MCAIKCDTMYVFFKTYSLLITYASLLYVTCKCNVSRAIGNWQTKRGSIKQDSQIRFGSSLRSAAQSVR